MNCMLRKFILGQINKVLENYKDNIQKARENVNVWLNRAKDVTACLESLSAKLADNKIDDKEIEDALAELEKLVNGWKK